MKKRGEKAAIYTKPSVTTLKGSDYKLIVLLQPRFYIGLLEYYKEATKHSISSNTIQAR